MYGISFPSTFSTVSTTFAPKLKNAKAHLFTFPMDEDVGPASNGAGRALKAVIRQSRCREQRKPAGSMKISGVLLTGLETWMGEKASI
ncbi:hypothetical protein CENSYa_1121 [Cenarchaeum symbiosum A]|uniref:Uncharacterized protein n=1 Tax=Cenarchaeum symbiosum (strain A) TaxID=414004 RepID=A0RWN3_CENSY|nr:hypothetical protein CENSYa_1121 [Cenarchaeum symbiosum A]